MADKNQKAKKANPQEDVINKAHVMAEHDIEKDPDFKPDPAADLDEGELARLEGEE